jgi:hypothetical protein
MVSLIVVLILIGLALWAVGMLPIDPAIMNVIRAVVVVLAVLYVLAAFGVIDSHWRID